MVTPHRKQFITTQKTWGNKSGSIEVRVSKRTFFYFKDEQTLTLFLTTQLIPLWMIVESISAWNKKCSSDIGCKAPYSWEDVVTFTKELQYGIYVKQENNSKIAQSVYDTMNTQQVLRTATLSILMPWLLQRRKKYTTWKMACTQRELVKNGLDFL